jgi:O-antigen ligase
VPFLVAGALAFRKRRLFFALALVLAVAGVYFSFSRGALVGLVLIPFIFLPARWSLIAVPVVAIALAIASPQLIRERFDTSNAAGSDLASRVDFWRAAENIWENHPVLGVGLGGFPNAYVAAPVPGKQFLPDTEFEPPPHAHNLYLNVLAEQGLIGFLALLALGAATIRYCLRLRRDNQRWVALIGTAGLAMIVAGGVHNLFDVTLVTEQTGTYFCALLGVLSAVTLIQARARERAEEADGAEPEAQLPPADRPPVLA